MSKVLILWNPCAGSADQRAAAQASIDSTWERGELEVVETASADQATRFAARAAGEDRLLVAAGGDGTINAVARGLLCKESLALAGSQAEGSHFAAERPDPPRARLAIIPLGTGNDLARSLKIPLDPAEAVAAITHGRVRQLDIIRVAVDGRKHLLLNAATGGNAADLGWRLNEEQKRRWGAWAYIRGAVDVTTDLESHPLRLQIDGGLPQFYHAFNVLVANGRTVAGGIPIAPPASLEDGAADVIVIKEGRLAEPAATAAEVVLGDYLQSEQVVHRRGSRATVACEREMVFSIDGEVQRGKLFEFVVVPGAIAVVVGPDYVPGTSISHA